MFYVNMAMSFYGIIASMSFTASATLASRRFEGRSLMNYFSALVGLMCSMLFCAFHPIMLFTHKE